MTPYARRRKAIIDIMLALLIICFFFS